MGKCGHCGRRIGTGRRHGSTRPGVLEMDWYRTYGDSPKYISHVRCKHCGKYGRYFTNYWCGNMVWKNCPKCGTKLKVT